MNVNLINALVSQLEAAHRIAVEIQTNAKKEVFGDVVGNIGAFLRATTSGETNPPENVETTAAPEPKVAEPAVATVATPVTPVATRDEVLITMLNDPDYTLRSAASLIEKSGFDGDHRALAEYLEEDLGLDIVLKTRRSDRAPMIGLEDRN